METTDVSRLRPLHDQVIVRRIEEDYTAGGIVLPQSDNAEMAPRGEVVAVGPGRASEFDGHLSPMSVKVGDIVYLTPGHVFATIPFMFGSETLYAVRDRELVVCVH